MCIVSLADWINCTCATCYKILFGDLQSEELYMYVVEMFGTKSDRIVDKDSLGREEQKLRKKQLRLQKREFNIYQCEK